MANIFVSVPILDKPEFKMVYNLYSSILSCKEHRIRLFVNENDSLISRVRNVHISLFLREFKDYDYFVSIDSDLEIVNCFHTNNIFSKLIAHDEDFVGGLYALKNPKGDRKSSSLPLDLSIERDKMPFNSGLIEMRWLSAGCWCIKRSAIEKMVASYPELDYIGDDNVAGSKIHGLYIPQIFDVEDSTSKQNFKKYLSEDWAFCERYRKLGGKIYADTSIVLKHIGKFPYSLWNVEVVQRKAEKAESVAPQEIDLSMLDEISQNPKKLDPPTTENKSELPPPGWDLANKV